LPEENLYKERELLLRISEGDERAFEAIYDQNWRKVYSYIEPIVKSDAIAEEMVIDIFLILWQSRERLQDMKNIGAFLRTVARNKALDFVKITARQGQRERLYRAESFFRLPATPHDELLEKEIIEIYRESIAHLSPQRKKIYLMYREEGLSYNEIGEILNISPTTAKKSFFDALSAIRKFLQNHYSQLKGLIYFVFLHQFLK